MSHQGDVHMATPRDPFKEYEPRPEYRKAAQVTEHNLEAIAKHIGRHRNNDTDPRALVDHSACAIILQLPDGTQIGRARHGDYIIETVAEGTFNSAWSIANRYDFEPQWRKRLGDD